MRIQLPFSPWARFLVERGTLEDLLTLHAMPGVYAFRVAPNREVQLASEYEPRQLTLLALAYSRGRVLLRPADGRGPEGGAA